MANRVPHEFIKSLQGKDFVLYGGLLELAHQDGLSASDTQILQFPTPENSMTCIVKATVTTKKGTFTGIGDASPTSVPNKAIAVHAIRMAETRAMARALRVATNVSLTAFEELGGHDDEPKAGKQTKQTTPPPIVQHFTPPNASILADIKRIATLLNLTGDDFVQWLKDTHNTTYKRLDDETSRLVLMDLQELCADASADAVRADGLAYEAMA